MNDIDLSTQRALSDALPHILAQKHPAVTVIGDVMLDGWWTGNIERMCREAPAPVVDLLRREFSPGGAANTAMNLAALGAKVTLVGVVGMDANGERLRALLREGGVDVRYLLQLPGVVTPTKIRVSSAGQIMFRLDDCSAPVPEKATDSLAAVLPEAVAGSDAVIICDYGTGTLENGMIGKVAAAVGLAKGRPLTVVDAHDPRNWSVLEPDLVTPNAQESSRMLGIKLPEGAARAAFLAGQREKLLQLTGAKAVVATLDRDGTMLLTDGPSHRTWARPATEKQASGAGDTFVAALTIGRACGLPLTTSLDLAQAAADVVVQQAGTAICKTEQLSRYLGSFAETTLEPSELMARLEAERAQGRRIVLTNGCFDVLHRGHTRYLNQARQLGDVLVVALNSDESVRNLKGPGRPINHVADRAAVIGALSCVDYVTVFETPTPIPLIQQIRPEIYAKGGDYTASMLEETAAVEQYGGEVAILEYVPEQSTTAVVERIRNGGSREVGA